MDKLIAEWQEAGVPAWIGKTTEMFEEPGLCIENEEERAVLVKGGFDGTLAEFLHSLEAESED